VWFYPVKSAALGLDGGTLDYVRFGTGHKTLILLPGLGLRGVKGAGYSLAYLYRLFARDYTVYVLDKRQPLSEHCTLRALAADVAQAMERLCLGPACVFGVSQGGMIAQYLAIDFPHLVEKLVLGVTASRTNRVMEQAINGWIQLADQGDYQGLVLDMFEKMYSPAYLKKYRPLFPLLTRIGKPKDTSRFLTLVKACLTCNTYPELYKIVCPTFVLGGALDSVLTGEASRELSETLRCPLTLYPDLGHGAYEEAKDFNRRIYNFLKQ
jgi:pimeloyl-ACP methyl ester carboxylesterase